MTLGVTIIQVMRDSRPCRVSQLLRFNRTDVLVLGTALSLQFIRCYALLQRGQMIPTIV